MKYRLFFLWGSWMAAAAGCGSGAGNAGNVGDPDASSPGAADGSPLADASSATDSSSSTDASADAGAGGTTCDVQYGKPVCHGTLDPTTLGPGIKPVGSSVGTSPGQHYYCYPADPGAFNGKMLLHLVGTTDDPAKDNALLRLACSLGFAAIAPMYENAIEAGKVCAMAPTRAGSSACFGQYREAILYGKTPQLSFIPQITPADAIVARTHTLLAALAQREARFPAWSSLQSQFDAKSFGSFVLSGHSQGSGHALMLARDFAALRLVMLGGVPDRVASGTSLDAAPDWIAGFAAAGPRTPVASYYGYNNAGDTVAVFTEVQSNYDVLGVSTSASDFIGAASPAYPASCRRVNVPAGCTNGLDAHGSVTVSQFGPPPLCGLGTPGHDNQATWTFLLTNP